MNLTDKHAIIKLKNKGYSNREVSTTRFSSSSKLAGYFGSGHTIEFAIQVIAKTGVTTRSRANLHYIIRRIR